LQYSDHQIGQGAEFYAQACELCLEGIISKRAEAAYSPGNRGLWVKVKCQNREEFVVVGWTDPEGARPWLGALLLAYYDPDGRLILCGARRGWNRPRGTRPAVASPASSRHVRDAARSGSPSIKPVWFGARAEPRALGTV
jgi:bifunctional non-homologous end joining protein LigD